LTTNYEQNETKKSVTFNPDVVLRTREA